MNHSLAPSLEDIENISVDIWDVLPQDIVSFCKDTALVVEEFCEDQDIEIEDSYEILALYRTGRELAPGVEKKEGGHADTLVLYRRAILDFWIETGEDLSTLIRQIMIEELGRNFGFSEEEIEDMISQNAFDFL